MGVTFLQHFFSVYDFDRDEISLGVNIHSKDKVKMYSASSKLQQILVQKQSQDINMLVQHKFE